MADFDTLAPPAARLLLLRSEVDMRPPPGAAGAAMVPTATADAFCCWTSSSFVEPPDRIALPPLAPSRPTWQVRLKKTAINCRGTSKKFTEIDNTKMITLVKLGSKDVHQTTTTTAPATTACQQASVTRFSLLLSKGFVVVKLVNAPRLLKLHGVGFVLTLEYLAKQPQKEFPLREARLLFRSHGLPRSGDGR